MTVGWRALQLTDHCLRLRLLPSLSRTIETDVCVVGAGVIGLAHAHEARRRGLSVVVLERDARASGASVRQTGHLFFSALASGAALDAAPRARERWLELADRAGVAVDEGGTLILARHRDELAVLEGAAAEQKRHARMRSPKKIGRLVPIPTDGILGAFHAKHDLRIGPRSAPAALARLLTKDPSARVEWGAHVHEIEPGVVHAGALRVRAEAIVLCPGADHRMLPAELWPRDSGVTLRQTQMLRLAAPSGRRYRQTLATGLSLLEHPAFCAQEGAQELRERLELETPELVERGVSLVVTQLSDGELVIGSTSTYTEAPSPYLRERLDGLVLDQAREVLGIEPAVRQRWGSTHVSLPTSPVDFLVTHPMAGVRVVQGARSTAAALCHAQAETVLDELLAEPPSKGMYISVRDMRTAAANGGGLHDHASAFGSPQRTS
jgi:D-hydroxyproline dehydrogenase subunit beta